MTQPTPEPVHWSTIEPKDATKIKLPRADIIGPVNELGEPCPWPWEPQQLGGAPMGQYHCGYCGGMQMAGLPHMDWTDQTFEEIDAQHQSEENHPAGEDQREPGTT